MSREDIERLQQKIAKDPDSKLFVPLAEEYKKAGMIDEAIGILSQGLERQPHYLSARVSLGKILMGRGLLNEAKEEFLKVIAVIPDNLYAHKKLAEIHQELGDRDSAINELKDVLNLNPTDEWAISTLSVIEKGTQPIPAENLTLAILSAPEPAGSLTQEGQEKLRAAPDILPEEEEPLKAQLPREEIPYETETVEPEVPPRDAVLDPEHSIRQGNYHEALAAYKTILSEDPENREILQRVAELKALLKMLGRDQEAHIMQLETFLEGIRKRRDEFISST
jgi:tetratricopeptide (TPR) repeat protein